MVATARNVRWALWPEGLDLPEPGFDSEPEKSRLRVFSTSELLAEPVRGNERNRSRTTFNGPALPYKPHVEVQDTGCVRQGRDGLALDRYPVLIDFTVECLAKDDFILEGFVRRSMGFVAIVEPKVHAIKKVKASQVHDWRFVRLLFCAEENRGGKDSLESLDHAAVVGGRPWASERIQGFGRQIRSGSHGCFVSRRG